MVNMDEIVMFVVNVFDFVCGCGLKFVVERKMF